MRDENPRFLGLSMISHTERLSQYLFCSERNMNGTAFCESPSTMLKSAWMYLLLSALRSSIDGSFFSITGPYFAGSVFLEYFTFKISAALFIQWVDRLPLSPIWICVEWHSQIEPTIPPRHDGKTIDCQHLIYDNCRSG